MWNYAHNGRSVERFTSDKWMNFLPNCQRQTQKKWSQKHKPRCKNSYSSLKTDKIWHALKKEVNTSRHNNASRNTLSSQLDTISLELAATTPPENILPKSAFQLFTDTHMLPSAIKHRSTSTAKRKTDSFTCTPALAEDDLAPLFYFSSPVKGSWGGSGVVLAPPGFPPWAQGSSELERASQNPDKTTECYLV